MSSIASGFRECVRVLKDEGTLWVSGTLHNHPSIGMALKELGLWIINDLIWYKPNATPLLQTKRLAPATELIWIASKTKRYYFNYGMAKRINGGKQMRNLWVLPAEKHRTDHPAEKPEWLLTRILLIASRERDTVLDPFMGSGTTGVAAKKTESQLYRHRDRRTLLSDCKKTRRGRFGPHTCARDGPQRAAL